MITVIISAIVIIIAIFAYSNLDKKEGSQTNKTPDYENELTIKTTQMIHPQVGQVEEESFTFIANYKGTQDLARILDNGYVDLYKRVPGIDSKYEVNENGKKYRVDSFIMDDERYDVSFIQNSDIKISILTLKYNLVTHYK